MRALVLSGGGRKGAYQVGALQFLLADRAAHYDYIFGVSVGALNAALLAMYPKGKEAEAADRLKDVWKGISTAKIYKRWFPFGKLHGLWKPSFYNSAPLKKLVEEMYDPEKVSSSGKKFGVGAVSLKTGEYRLFTEADPDIVAGILASSAFPAMLLPERLDNQVWVDGGVRNVTPLKSAITMGAEEIDVIMTMSREPKISPDNSPNAINVAVRAIDIVMNEVANEDVDRCETVNDRVKKGNLTGKRIIGLRVLRPQEELAGDSLDFDSTLIRANIAQGYEEAKEFFGS